MKRRAFIAGLAGALVVPSWADAQTAVRPASIGVIEFGNPPDGGFVRGYLAALSDLGYVERVNLRVERRYAQGNPGRFGELLGELASSGVRLVFTVGNDIAQVAKNLVLALPIVTAGSEDPVMSGLIADFRRPGGNITGVTYLSTELAAKRLELLRDSVPGLARVAVLWDPAHFDTYYKDMESAARARGIQLHLFEVRDRGEIEVAIKAAGRLQAQAVFVVPSRMLNIQARRLGELAIAARMPTIAAYANFAEAGGLLSYGAVAQDMLRRAAVQTAQILGGAKAGDLPFERAATFELVVNLKTARALGITIPQSLLLRADRVIE
ncbi:MAG: ABC transporter substrate-binding protein [Betaproteobacteria bacterium]